MASDLEAKAKDAFIDEHFELAVELYNRAIPLSPQNAALYAERAQANIKLENFTEAVADASRAIELDPSNPKAHMRKGIACMKLEEYQTARAAFEAGAALAPEESRFTKLIKECEKLIAEETGTLPQQSVEKSAQPTVLSSTDAQLVNDPPSQATTMTVKPKFRHEFYQKPEEVVVTIFAKGIHTNNVSVDFGEQILSVRIDIPGEEGYHLQPRLFGKIIPAKCRFDVLSTKIEIRLAKSEQIHWKSLEFSSESTIPQRVNASAIVSMTPTYPSSKSRGVNWDMLEYEMKKQEKEEKLDGDAALNKFFRDIYQDADEDMRRAMQKSFVESNGTVLSTNWKDVGEKKVEGSPPDGMEMKKWEY